MFPDYSAKNNKLNMYAHVGPTDGHYVDEFGVAQNTGEDYRTPERFKEYKDLGLDTLLLLGNDPYNGEEFSTSQLKKNLDMAFEAGLKVIVFHQEIHDLSSNVTDKGRQIKSLVGKGCRFATQEDLEAYVATLIAPYKDHPAFYGITVFDEPSYVKMKSVGQVYRALKSLVPDIYIPVVLLPYMNEKAWIKAYTGKEPGKNNDDPEKAYYKYVRKYFSETKAKNLLYDDYPFRFFKERAHSEFIRKTYLRNLQIMSEFSKKHGAHLEICVQDYSMKAGLRHVDEDDVRWQINTVMSFGVDNIIHYTYWMFPNQTGPDHGGEGCDSAIIDNFGNKILYDQVKTVNDEIKSLAETVLSYDYMSSRVVGDTEGCEYFEQLRLCGKQEGIRVIKAKGTILINSMKDGTENLRGYFIINASDPIKKESAEISLSLGKTYNSVKIINRGIYKDREIESGTVLDFKIGAGDAIFIIPYNK